MDTKEYYGGTYPEPAKEKPRKRILKLTVVGNIMVDVNCTTNEIESELDKIEKELNDDSNLVKNINIESWEEI